MIENCLKGDVVRKLVATGDLRKVISLTLLEKKNPKSKNNQSVTTVLLEITDIPQKKLIFSKPYNEITSTLISSLFLLI